MDMDIEGQAVWAQVLYFKVYRDNSESTQPERFRIFNNGRQQCPVKVDIIVADANGNPVVFPGDSPPKLIDYNTGYPIVPSFWTYTETKNDFLWDESIVPAASEEPREEPDSDASLSPPKLSPDALRQKRSYIFYVSTRISETKRLAAQVIIPGTGVIVTTNSPTDDPENGMFNSSVFVQALPFPNLPIENYGVFANDGNLLPYEVGSGDYFFWTREHYVHVSINGIRLPIRFVSAKMSEEDDNDARFGIWSKRSTAGDPVRWAVSYYGIGESSVSFGPVTRNPVYVIVDDSGEKSRQSAHTFVIPKMFNDCIGEIIGRSQYQLVVGLLMGNIKGHLLNAASISIENKERADFYILDAHGNYHALAIVFGGKLNQLRLVKA